jgi:release factor H-coupled RctB family protein
MNDMQSVNPLKTPSSQMLRETAIDRVISPVAEINHLFSNNTWVSPEAYTQLSRVAKLPGMIKIAALPDLHPGTGSPGGAAYISDSLIHPQLIGGDIGCGMLLCATSLDSKLNAKRVAKSLDNIDRPFDGELSGLIAKHTLEGVGYQSSLGSIGGGNHFAEIQVIHHIENVLVADELGIRADKALLLIHSGSRGLGQAVLKEHNANSRDLPLDPNSDEGKRYLLGHDQAIRYARANRELIADRFLDGLGAKASPLLDLPHNFLEQKTIENELLWIHRKGAAPSDRGLVVIPGSRSSFTYVVRPLGDGNINGHSLAHGAGRKVSRSQCDDKFGRLSTEELQRPRDKERKIDNLVICENRELLRQEHGKAYKDIDRVIEDLKAFGLIEVIAILKPVLTYKTRSENTDGEG